MKGKDEIKELFQKELGNYEAKVDPSLWNGIQSGLSGVSAAGGATTGMSVATKAVIGVVIATVATISSIVIFSNEEIKGEKQAKVEKIEPIQETKENISEDLVVKKTNENFNQPKAENKTEIKETPNIEVEDKVSVETETIDTPEVNKTNDKGVTKKEESQKPTDTSNPNSTENKNKENENKEEVEKQKPLSADISIEKQENQYVKFKLIGENINNVEWSFGNGRYSNEVSPEHFYEEPGRFEAKATIYGNNDSVIEKKITVNVEVEGRFTNLPNIFSPNNDGSNDEFFVEYEGIEDFQLNIFNKQQELIFTTDDPNFRWRGYNQNGVIIPKGIYIYVIIAKDKAGNVINKYETLEVVR